MTPKIETHAWRPSTIGGSETRPYAERPCVYMSCDRPLAEHTQPVVSDDICPCPVYDREPGDEVCLCGHYLGRHAPFGGECRAVGL